MGVLSRAVRNISRRKVRALLVIIALGFCMAIMISIPAGITSNQASTENLTQNLSETITQTEETINQTQTQIDCTLAPSFEGFGFNPSEMPDRGDSDFVPPTGDVDSPPGQFGGGFRPGQFGGGPFGRGGTTAMNETLYEDISSVDSVAAVMPSLEASEGTEQIIERFGQSFTTLDPDYIIKGIPLTSDLVDNYPVLPTTIIDGRNLQSGDSGAVLLSQNNTAFFEAEVGETIDILDQSFKVIGVYKSSGVEDEMTLYVDLSDAQTVTNNTGYITSITVFADNSDVVTDVANAISALHPELAIVTSQQLLNQLDAMKTNYEIALENAESTVAQTQSSAVQEIIVAVAATSLIILFVMLYTVHERTKEIGTLKAIGFSNWTVMSQFMLEGVFLSLMAGVVGVAIASVAAPALSELLLPAASQGNFAIRFASAANSGTTASMALAPELILIALGGAVLLGTLGSLYPAWRASRTRPAEAMRYE